MKKIKEGRVRGFSLSHLAYRQVLSIIKHYKFMKKKYGNRVLTYYTLKKTLKIIRIVLFLLLISVFHTIASVRYLQGAKITLKCEGLSLVDALSRIEDQSEYRFIYDKSQINLDQKVKINLDGATLGKVLKELFVNKGINYHMIHNQIILNGSVSEVLQQIKTISGKVCDSSGSPLPGVTIVVNGTTHGTVTDVVGNYTLANVPRDATLVFAFIGMKTESILVGNKTTIDVSMMVEAVGIGEVVTIGYGTMKKSDLVGAVDQVNSEVLANRPTPNLARSLQGEVAGLNISFTDSKPSRSTSINIRGANSIGAGGSALILIDGVEGDISSINPQDVESVSVLKDASSSAIYGARGAFGVVLITTKSPQKGTPIVKYSGSVSFNKRTVRPDMITDGLDWVDWWIECYNGYYTGSRSLLDHLDSTVPYTEEIHQELVRRKNDPSLTKIMKIDGHSQFDWGYMENTNWYDLMYKNYNLSHEHNISISGGDDVSDYYISGRFYDYDGIYKVGNESYKRYDLRSKGSLKVRPWFKITSNTSFSNVHSYQPKHPRNNFNTQRALMHAGMPLSPIKNPDGTWTTAAAISGYASFSEGTSYRDNKNLYLRQKISADIDIIKDVLKFQADYSYNYTSKKRIDMQVPVEFEKRAGVTLYESASAGAKLGKIDYDTRYQASNAYFTYSPKLDEVNNFTAVAGWNVEKQEYKTLSVSRADFITVNKPSFSLMNGVSTDPMEGGNAWSYMGGFYRLNYSYMGKYLVELSGRYDGSSKFPTNSKWGFFPSASAGWNFSKESWMSWSKNVMDNAKIRGSIGSMGNGNVSPYSYTSNMTVSTANNILLGGILPSYTAIGTTTPASLTWEKATTYDIGLDMGFLGNKLSFTGDIYRRATTDMYTASVSLPSVYGTSPPKGNNAEMNTDGWELSIQWKHQVNLGGKPLSYSVKATVWNDDSKITKFANKTGTLGTAYGYMSNGGSPSTYYEGMHLGEIWGYEVAGLFKDQDDIDNSANQHFKQSHDYVTRPGQVKFVDLDKSGVIDPGKFEVEDHGDLKIIGNQNPKYHFGLNLSSEWNGFGLSVFVQGVGKKDWYPGSDAGYFWGKYGRPYFSFIPSIQNLSSDDVYSAEKNNWDTAYWPALTTYQSSGNKNWVKAYEIPNTRYLQNAMFVRIKNIRLDYSFNKNICNSIGLQDVNIYISGDNLFTFTPLHKHAPNFDPEGLSYDADFDSQVDGYTYPTLKNYTVGLNITF